MTMTEGSGDDDVFDGVFDRETPQETVVDTTNTETPSGPPRDERGRFASSQPQQEAQAELQPQAETTPHQDPNANRHVPLSEHLGERTKYKERISQIEKSQMESEARAKAYEQQIQQLLNQRQQPQPQVHQPVEEEPDPYSDPQGWAKHQRDQVTEMLRQNRAAMSQRFAVQQYGAEAVQQALANVPSNVANNLYVNSADPFGDLMEWHKEQQVRKEVGSDLDGYKKRIEEEVRQKVLAELKAGGASGQPQPKFPGSLAAATATGEQGGHLTEEAAMGSIFATGRDRRK
jgi:hypothetical protein